MNTIQLIRSFPSIIRGLWVRCLILAMGGKCGFIFVDRNFDLRSLPHKGIEIGSKVSFGPDVKIYVPSSGCLRIGDGCTFTANNYISAHELIEIHSNTLIAENTSIRDADHSYLKLDIPIKFQPMSSAPIRIGSGVWIGCGVAILKGSCIGEGAIIGANSVVKTSIPANAVAVGVPVKIIHSREVAIQQSQSAPAISCD